MSGWCIAKEHAMRRIALGAALLVSLLPGQPAQRIEITVERKSGDKVELLDPGAILNNGDLIRFRFRTNFAGYLYVRNQSSSGKYMQLFPKEEVGTDNRVRKDGVYVLPASDRGWFRVEGPAGQESVHWIVSPAPLAAPPPSSMTPRCDDALFQARGQCTPEGGDAPFLYIFRLAHR